MTVFPQRPFFILYKKVQVKLADIDFSMSAKVGYAFSCIVFKVFFFSGFKSLHCVVNGWTTLRKETFENIVGKEEILLTFTKASPLVKIHFSAVPWPSANAFNMKQKCL